MIRSNEKLTEIQLELLKSFRFISDKKQLSEVRSLLNFYFKTKLDKEISKEESSRNYSADIYKKWLESSNK